MYRHQLCFSCVLHVDPVGRNLRNEEKWEYQLQPRQCRMLLVVMFWVKTEMTQGEGKWECLCFIPSFSRWLLRSSVHACLREVNKFWSNYLLNPYFLMTNGALSHTHAHTPLANQIAFGENDRLLYACCFIILIVRLFSPCCCLLWPITHSNRLRLKQRTGVSLRTFCAVSLPTPGEPQQTGYVRLLSE